MTLEAFKNDTHYLSDVNLVATANGHIHSLALGSNGRLYGWGCGSNGRLGLKAFFWKKWLKKIDEMLCFNSINGGSIGKGKSVICELWKVLELCHSEVTNFKKYFGF